MKNSIHEMGKKRRGFLLVILLLVLVCLGVFANPVLLNSSGSKVQDHVEEVSQEQSEILPGSSGQNDEKPVEETQQETENTDRNQDDDSGESDFCGASARIVMVGDVLLHTPVSESGLQEDGSYRYDHLFANVKDEVISADLALVNQEVILGGRELGLSGYPAFNGAYEVGDALVDAGFDVVLHATNHALDKGKTGILHCLDYWRNTHPEITVLGIHDSQENYDQLNIVKVNGINIAILNYTYGTNGIPLPEDMPFAVNLMEREKIRDDLWHAEEEADFTIVCPHWGIEYTHQENNEQIELACFMAENGADLIIGTHPHVIQPVKWVEACNGNRALVYYSLGNYINATSEYGSGVADRMVGAMAEVTLTRQEDSDSVVISDYQAIPLVTQMLTGSGQITTYLLSDYNEALASQNEVLTRDSAFSYDYCVNLASEVLKKQ